MFLLPIIAILASIVATLALIFSPATGLLLAFLVRPVVDTAFDQSLGVGLRLTEAFSVVVPCCIFFHMLFTAKGSSGLASMPLRAIWLIWVADVILFSVIIMVFQGPMDGLNVLFRHLNGFMGFYAIQAFLREERDLRRFLLFLILAGLFPVGVGVYQLVTGYQWHATYAEGLERNIGLYHSAIIVRYYSMQTIFALLLFSALYLRGAVVFNIAAAIYGVLSAAVMFKAYSKSGMATLALWFLAWTLLQKKFLMLLITSLAAFVVAAYYSSEIIDEILQIFGKEIGVMEGTMKSERSFAGRWYLWQRLWAEWENLPVLGKLFGAGRTALGAHNDYLQILFHGGIVGLGIYVLLLFSVGQRILRNLMVRVDPLAVAALLAFIMWMVDTLGLVPSAYSGYQWFVWGVIGLSLRKRLDEAKSVGVNPRAV